MITFAINHKIFSLTESIVPYHLTNTLIHLLTTLAVFFFCQALTFTREKAHDVSYIKPDHFCLLVAAFWALNPVQTSAVTYLVQRMASMATLFYISGLACYIHARISTSNRRRFLFTFLTLLFSFMSFHSKEISATLPFSILLIELCFMGSGKRVWNFLKSIKKYQWIIMAFCSAVLLNFTVTSYLTSVTFDHRYFTLGERLLTESRIVVFYISLLLLPLPGRLNLDHSFPLSQSILNPPTTILSFIALATILYLAIKTVKSNPLICFGVIFFFLNLIIESTILPLELVFEHRLYLPSIGLFIALLDILDISMNKLRLTVNKPSKELYLLFILVMVSLISLCSLLTTLRNHTWRDAISLHQDILSKSPDKPRAYVNLAREYATSDINPDEVILLLDKAIELSRNNAHKEVYTDATTNIVAALIKEGRNKEAIERGVSFLAEIPPSVNLVSLPVLLVNLAIAYEKENDISQAINYCIKGFLFSLQKDPSVPLQSYNKQYYINLIRTLLSKGYEIPSQKRKLSFVQTDSKELAINLKIASLLINLRQYREARIFIEKVLRTYPNQENALLYMNKLPE